MPMLLQLECHLFIYLSVYLFINLFRGLQETVSCLLYCPVLDPYLKRIMCIGVTL